MYDGMSSLVQANVFLCDLLQGYFYLLKWAAVGFAALQLLILIILLVLKFLPVYHYEQFPFLPSSITEAYKESPKDVNVTRSGSSETDEDEGKAESLILPLVTRTGERSPTSYNYYSTTSAGPSYFFAFPSFLRAALWLQATPSSSTSSEQLTHVLPLASTSHEFEHHVAPVILTNMEKHRNVHIVTFLVLYSVLNSIYLTVLYFYTRKLHHEAFFSQSEAISRRAAFYVHPQFAQGGPTDNKSSSSQVQPPNKLQGNSTTTITVTGPSTDTHEDYSSNQGLRDTQNASPQPQHQVNLPASKFPIQNWAPKVLPRFEPLPNDVPTGSGPPQKQQGAPPSSHYPGDHNPNRPPPIPDRRRGMSSHGVPPFTPQPPRFHTHHLEDDMDSCSSSRVYTPPPQPHRHGMHPRDWGGGDEPSSSHVVHNRRLSHVPPSTVPRPPPPTRHLSFDTAPSSRYRYPDDRHGPPIQHHQHGQSSPPSMYKDGAHRALPQINYHQRQISPHPSFHQQSQPPPIMQKQVQQQQQQHHYSQPPPPLPPHQPIYQQQRNRYLPQSDSASSPVGVIPHRPAQQRMLPIPPRGRHPTSVV